MSKSDKDRTVTPFAAAYGVDAIVRRLQYLPGMTPEDKRAVRRIRLELGGIRLRHMPALDGGNLPEDLAKCLNGPAVEVRHLTVSGARGRV